MQACCPSKAPPVQGDLNYQKKGTSKKVHDFELYSVGEGKKVILVVYDIFGVHPNTVQLCDILAQSGFRVILPDFFKGDKWSEGFDDMQKLYSWIGKVSAPEIINTVFTQSLQHITEDQGSDFTVGLLGFCWGAKVCFSFAPLDDRVKALGGVHPSFLNIDHAKGANVPIMLLNSKDEPLMEDIQAELNSKPFAGKNIWKVYPTMHHGFCAARGDWTNEEQAKCANDALGISAQFFSDNL